MMAIFNETVVVVVGDFVLLDIGGGGSGRKGITLLQHK